MSRLELTKCDCCGETVPIYHGALLEVVEQHACATHVYPTSNNLLADLCDSCYEPVAKLLQQMRVKHRGA